MNRAVIFALPVFVLLAHPAHAQTTLVTGHHDNNTSGNGYEAPSGPLFTPGYVVPADSGTAADATFNNNSTGFYAQYCTVTVQGGQFNNNVSEGFYLTDQTSVTVNGGQFTGNGVGLSATYNSTALVTGGTFTGNQTAGVSALQSAAFTITGGTFSNNAAYGLNTFLAPVTVTGGTFDNNLRGLYAYYFSSISVTGGQFTGNRYGDLYADYGSVIDLFGTGFTDDAGHVYRTGDTITSGSGTLHGTLLNGQPLNSSYVVFSSGDAGSHATIEFNVGPVPAPEPSSLVALAVGVLGLGALTMKARRRQGRA